MPTLPTTDANDPNIGPECSSGCVICDRNPQLEGLYGVWSWINLSLFKSFHFCQLDSPEKWLSLRGNYFMVTAANISCKCHRAPRGVSPYCHLGDGFLDVVVASSGDYIDNIKVCFNASKILNSITNHNFPLSKGAISVKRKWWPGLENWWFRKRRSVSYPRI